MRHRWSCMQSSTWQASHIESFPSCRVDFQSLDTERLTEEQQTVIQQRQAQLQLLWQRRQKQEEAEQAQERERKASLLSISAMPCSGVGRSYTAVFQAAVCARQNAHCRACSRK